MEDIVKEIAAAEQEAAQIRSDAAEQAQAILAAAEQEAEKIAKEAESARRSFREQTLAKAVADAEEAYKATIAAAQAAGEERLQEVLTRSAELSAGNIVGRIIGGNR